MMFRSAGAREKRATDLCAWQQRRPYADGAAAGFEYAEICSESEAWICRFNAAAVSAHFRKWPVWTVTGRAEGDSSARVVQTSICSAISIASSISMPR